MFQEGVGNMTQHDFLSKKRILIVAPPYRLSQTAYALGLMYIAAVLQREGHHVEVIDMDAFNLPMDDYVRELREREYDYFCTGGMITAWNFVVFSANLVKQLKPHVKVIVGGGIVSSSPQSLISVSSVDVGIIGEGEEAVVEVIHAFENGTPLSRIVGIAFQENGQVIETQHRKDIQNLDALPFPAWDLFKVGEVYSRFPSHFSLFKARRIGSIYTTRGCPFQCTFCYTEKAVRQRSIENVIEELKELKGRYGIRHILIVDDLFVVRKKRTMEFCEAMIKNKMNLTWSATGRCNIIDPEFLKAMRAAGCEFMGLGIESGSDTVLKAIKKSQTSKMIIEAVKMVQRAGITPGGTFILGLPPETRETIRETVDVYKQINRYRTHVNKFFFATPYPGTELYDQMKAKGRIGDEIQYFEKVSARGDAIDFCMNCTDSLTDEELIRMKREVEQEVFQDFVKKHPWHALDQYLSQQTVFGKLKNALIMVKMKGFKEGTIFVIKKILAKLKLIEDPYKRRWNIKQSYSYQQNIIEGKMVTF